MELAQDRVPFSRQVPGKWLVRHLEDAPLEKTICGTRRRLLSSGDEASAYAHLVRIDDASPHYHRRASEIYYVVEGTGAMLLDGEEIPLRPGTCVEVKPGVVHAARGGVLALVVGIPDISDADTFLPAASPGVGSCSRT